MPNLIHSLDGYSLMRLINLMKDIYPDLNFYCIHDCFAVTADKIELLLNIIRSIYTVIYSDAQYIYDFDRGVLNKILDMYNDQVIFDKETRIFTILKDNSKYHIPDIK